MKLKIFILSFFQICFLQAQLSHKVKELAKPLDSISYAESSNIGIAGEKSIVYDYFKKLSAIATNDELYYFARNGSNSLKFYSSTELFERKDNRFLEIYKYHSENPFTIRYQSGCVISRSNITQLLKSHISSKKYLFTIRNEFRAELKNNTLSTNMKKALKQIEKDCKKISMKSIEFYLAEIEKIDSEK
ncbi:hypothetical protein GCM10022217_05810 [Chryseobacterium ginsenosidimutans]|uniref:hypothetical protein n=1 Tax=Chryseobacterium ginsenosidimutans TaxID=687846 RepID=UPI0031D29C82